MTARNKAVLTGAPRTWSTRNFFAVFVFESLVFVFFSPVFSAAFLSATCAGNHVSSCCCHWKFGGVLAAVNRTKWRTGVKSISTGVCYRVSLAR